MFVVYALIFIFGTALGSFFSVIISRLDVKEGIWLGHSECPDCGHGLSWKDLIPMLSFLLMRGTCRYCRKPISLKYIFLELLSGLNFVAVFAVYGPALNELMIFTAVLSSFFLMLIFFDALYMILPDKIIFSALAFVLVFNVFFRQEQLKWLLLTALLFSGFFAIIYLVSKGRWMGFGDVKLALLIGFSLGYPLTFWAIVLSVWAAALYGMALMLLKKADMSTAIPFGSFMSALALIFLIFGNEISKKIQIITGIL